MTAKILIVDDVATNRIVLKVKLSEACYETIQAADAAGALAAARRERPDAVLLDLVLPDADGISVCEALKADPDTRDIPVIIVTASRDNASRTRALRAGADEFLSKPLDDLTLLARLRSLFRAREMEEELRLRETTGAEMGFAEAAVAWGAAPVEKGGRIALVTRRPETAMSLRRSLAPHLPGAQISVLGKDEALSAAAAEEADVFLIEAGLEAREDGLRLMSDLRSRPATRHAGVCILLAPGARDTGVMALDLGAADLVSTESDPEEMALRLQTQIRRKRQGDRLRASLRDGLRLALTDPLTGLYNRRYALPHLDRIAARARETGRRYAVMVIDIDRFKAVNDTWGHAAGDAVLTQLAERLRSNIRAKDLLARIGGEEFLVAMPDTSLGAARMAAERLCRLAKEHPILLPGGQGPIRVTLSIGLAIGGEPAGDDRPAEEIVRRADAALLLAKAEGRNQVTVSLSSAA